MVGLVVVHNLYASEEELVKQLCSGLSDNLADLFIQRTKHWPHPMMHDECFTLGTFDDLTENISCERAFFLFPIALDIALVQTDKNLFVTALSLLMSLASASGTTELPPKLIENKNIIESKLQSVANDNQTRFYWNSIKEWYRLKNDILI
jgi:hypothetical protein